MKTIDEIKDLISINKEILKERYKIKEISIFGSYIRGEQIETSDIDILVDFERPVSLLHIISFENYLSDLLGIKVDVIPKRNIRKEIKQDILKEAIPV